MNEAKKRNQPPKWIDTFLQWRLPEEQFEEVQGDMHELYEQWVEEMGKGKANRLYLLNAFTFLRPLPKRKNKLYSKFNQFPQANPIEMIHNYFVTAFRNVLRNKNYSLINIVGLSIGISVCLLIFLVVQFELSFDTFHTKRNLIYRVVREFKSEQGSSYDRGVQYPVGAALRNDFPELQKVAMIWGVNDSQIDIVDQAEAQKRFKEPEGLFFAEPAFFDIFDFTWLSGNAASALSQPNTVVLSKSTANKYFGSYQNALGKLIMLDNQQNRLLKVTGILDDVPANSDFPLKVVVSFQTLQGNLPDWNNTNSDRQCYVLLPEETTAENIQSRLPAFARKYLSESNKESYLLQPLSEIHFDSRLGNYNKRTVTKETIGGLILIGFFLLATSCINFVNLSTAQAFKRSKEVGIRKAIGSFRWQLITQFLSETFVITFVALLLAAGLAASLIPYLKDTINLPLELSAANMASMLLFLFLLLPLVTLFAGSYPALILSGFNPIEALKGKFTGTGGQGVMLRKGLVIFQFLITQVLIICTLIILEQMHYLQTADWGFNKESVVTALIPRDSLGVAGIESFRNRLQAQPDIKHVSFSLSSPASSRENFWNGFRYDQSVKEEAFSLNLKLADADYFKTYQMEFVAGRPYSQSDTIREVVVNETLLKKVGETNPQGAIGKNIILWGKKYPIVGVVKDFHIGSLKNEIAPVLLTTIKDFYWTVNIRLQTRQLSKTIQGIGQNYKSVYPQSLFEYQFVDETVAGFYKEEQKLSNLFKIFVTIAVAISCLGLYGLVSFMANQKVKEIGMRKVLGASVADIILLLTKDFLKLLSIAFVAASPIAWYLMSKWLENFEYRITPGIGVFVMAATAALLIALLTVGGQAIKAALANPVKSLKSEA